MKNFLTSEQAAERLGITSVTVRRWINDGKIAYVKTPGGHYMIQPSEIERLTTPIPAASIDQNSSFGPRLF